MQTKTTIRWLLKRGGRTTHPLQEALSKPMVSTSHLPPFSFSRLTEQELYQSGECFGSIEFNHIQNHNLPKWRVLLNSLALLFSSNCPIVSISIYIHIFTFQIFMETFDKIIAETCMIHRGMATWLCVLHCRVLYIRGPYQASLFYFFFLTAYTGEHFLYICTKKNN